MRKSGYASTENALDSDVKLQNVNQMLDFGVKNEDDDDQSGN